MLNFWDLHIHRVRVKVIILNPHRKRLKNCLLLQWGTIKKCTNWKKASWKYYIWKTDGDTSSCIDWRNKNDKINEQQINLKELSHLRKVISLIVWSPSINISNCALMIMLLPICHIAYLEFQRGCPNDIVVTTSLRSVAVTWDPPIFLANGQIITPQTPRYQPGQVFNVGRHKIKYEARLNGKKLKCDFKIYVRRKWNYSLNITACFEIFWFIEFIKSLYCNK